MTDPVHAWLRATLASLPEAVVELSVRSVSPAPDRKCAEDVRLSASLSAVPGGKARWCYDHGSPAPDDHTREAWAALGTCGDGLSATSPPFAHLLPVDDWITVTRYDLACAAPHVVDPMVSFTHLPDTEDGILAAIVEEIRDLPRGEATTIRVRRSTDGALTWNVTDP